MFRTPPTVDMWPPCCPPALHWAPNVSVAARVPTSEDMAARAESLLPMLRQRARETEEQRHVSTATIHEFLDAGLFRVLQPARFGGYELAYGRTQTELCNVLGRGCGS